MYWKVHVLFVLNDQYTLEGLLNYDLNGLSADGTLVGATNAKQQEISEYTPLIDFISAMMQTNAVLCHSILKSR